MFKWLRDARYDEVLSQIKQLQGDMQFLDAKLEALKTNMTSLRGLWNKKISKASDPDEEKPEMDIDAISKAFGGQLPIEFQQMQRYKNFEGQG